VTEDSFAGQGDSERRVAADAAPVEAMARSRQRPRR
jgi:hypothetical protein